MIVERTGYMKLEGGRLEVTLRRFTDREIDYAARHLCEDLNRMQPVTLDKFHLPIRYHVQNRKSTRLNSSHTVISYAVFCLKKKKKKKTNIKHTNNNKRSVLVKALAILYSQQ